MKQKRKDLVVVTADIQQKRTIATLLLERWQSLGIRQLAIDVDSDIFSLQNDPKVYHEGGRFLSTFARQYEYALVLIDAKWDGAPSGADEIERKIGMFQIPPQICLHFSYGRMEADTSILPSFHSSTHKECKVISETCRFPV